MPVLSQTAKASSERRAASSFCDLLHFYMAVVQPILEYVCSVWHPGLTVALSDAVKSLQKRGGSTRPILGQYQQ